MIRFKTRTKRAQDQAIMWLVKLESSTLTEADEHAFFQWLDASEVHQAAYVKAENLWQRGEALERITRNSEAPQSEWHMLWLGLTAACACLLVGVFYFLPGGGEFTEAAQYSTAVGEQHEHQLVDGSVLTLNTATRLQVDISAEQRIVTLEAGEAFFDIKHDPARPFDVVTAHGVTRVMGTRFSVRALDNDTVVTVLKGRVALGAKKMNRVFSTTQELQANEQLSLGAAQSGEKPASIDATNALAWRTRQLIFKGQPLHRVVAELNRYFPETLIVADPLLANKTITAVFQLNQFGATLTTLTASFGLTVEQVGDQYTLLEIP
ncbi:FecR family protein [Teredinibacter purpureus]|uniref:FecR family protein n=1 Tax=Teredinibacter purpureus TaxID=2731756 RepID=UPI0005F84109|nr:FecR family protein [Teredinibacter purpureus]